jgi:hypothetical protein
MVVGKDMAIEEILWIMGRTIVGRFCGKVVTAKSLSTRLAKNWKCMLGYRPDFDTLTKSWISFKFKL